MAGDGYGIMFTKDPWLPGVESVKIRSYLGHSLANIIAQELMLAWDADLIRDLFHERDREIILSIPLSFRRKSDTWYWTQVTNGEYTVKSGY